MKFLKYIPMFLASQLVSGQAMAQDVAAKEIVIMDKGDAAWMMISTVLVLFMILPGLALFYGGLVRKKNMLSVLVQTTAIAATMILLWVLVGYSLAFGGSESPYWGGLGKIFLKGVTSESMAATFSAEYVLPEYIFICFQMTFAAITPALIIGALVDRIKFSALMIFSVLWSIFVYFPIAHMVWDPNGLIMGWRAIDFAGGTVVHINAGIAALVGALVLGKRHGLGRENMAPHSMVMTMIGASMLWVGWFGFNAGSNLEANGGAALAMINTFVATAAGTLAWAGIEALFRGKASMLGAASGMVTGLVAVTPACGTVGPMGAIALGLIAAVICYYFVTVVKNKFGYDDSLDVFGIHGIGGIIGAVATGVFSASAFGGAGVDSIGGQLLIQIRAVIVTLLWSGLASFLIFKLLDLTIGIRVSKEDEVMGLDLATHGEMAYHD